MVHCTYAIVNNVRHGEQPRMDEIEAFHWVLLITYFMKAAMRNRRCVPYLADVLEKSIPSNAIKFPSIPCHCEKHHTCKSLLKYVMFGKGSEQKNKSHPFACQLPIIARTERNKRDEYIACSRQVSSPNSKEDFSNKNVSTPLMWRLLL